MWVCSVQLGKNLFQLHAQIKRNRHHGRHRGKCNKMLLLELLEDALAVHPPFAPFSLRIISSIKTSSPLFCLCVLYCISSIAHVFVVCKERTWKWENVKRRKCLAQQKAKHMTPKQAKREPKTPPEKKKLYWNAQDDIEFNSIRFVSVVLLQLPRRVPFVRLGTKDKVYLTEIKSVNNCEINSFKNRNTGVASA